MYAEREYDKPPNLSALGIRMETFDLDALLSDVKSGEAPALITTFVMETPPWFVEALEMLYVRPN
jgi:hypothetical protein